MSRCVDPLVVGRVIGEVVDMFVPSVAMAVAYGARDLSNGCHVMTDPDAPSPSEPTMREYLHWIVVNIPGGTDATKGEVVVPYMGPRPPVGIHRYVLKTRFPYVEAAPPEERAYFNTRAFAANHELGLPVAVVYFNSQKEPSGHRRR
uniref:Protein MOTHER of FT and TF 1 n=1 Tax=Aegilops tauschii TaxID=37682 RepID=R7W461_AEGTA